MREIWIEVIGVKHSQDYTHLSGFSLALQHPRWLGPWLPCGRIIVVSLAIINRKN